MLDKKKTSFISGNLCCNSRTKSTFKSFSFLLLKQGQKSFTASIQIQTGSTGKHLLPIIPEVSRFIVMLILEVDEIYSQIHTHVYYYLPINGWLISVCFNQNPLLFSESLLTDLFDRTIYDVFYAAIFFYLSLQKNKREKKTHTYTHPH